MKKNISVVWQPRYSTKDMLIAKRKVTASDCYVFFSSDPKWPDVYTFDGAKVIKECSIDRFGNYIVPLSWLTKFTEFPADNKFMTDWKAEEDAKYRAYLTKKKGNK